MIHPTAFAQFRLLTAMLEADAREGKILFKPFETYRSPERQKMLFAQGRTTQGKRVTDATQWQSSHQYGLAVDYVGWIDGKWNWDDVPHEDWGRMRRAAIDCKLTQPIAGDRPHIEHPFFKTMRGHFPRMAYATA